METGDFVRRGDKYRMKPHVMRWIADMYRREKSEALWEPTRREETIKRSYNLRWEARLGRYVKDRANKGIIM